MRLIPYIMPREARKQSATDLYHIMLRGIDGMDIFREKDDRKMFVTLLKQQISESFKIYCYCLMSNHIHCLIKSEKLSFHLHKLAATYAMWFNHKYERRGYLYQDRFKSEPVEDETYFIQCFRYILQNPVKAGLCHHASQYAWSSYPYYYQKETSFISTGFLTRFFKNRQEFENYMTEEDDGKYLEFSPSTLPSNACVKEIWEQKRKGWENLSPAEQLSVLRKMKETTNAGIRQLVRITGISINRIRKL